MLSKAWKKDFCEEGKLSDWVMLVETLLQWEAYLTLPQMPREEVVRLKRKNRYLLYLLKNVCNQQEGMGFRVMKFHVVTHLADDILMFGVPTNVDTGSNESHHKVTKVAAKLTQKDPTSFEEQTCHRLDDIHLLSLSMEELQGRPLFLYEDGYKEKKT